MRRLKRGRGRDGTRGQSRGLRVGHESVGPQRCKQEGTRSDVCVYMSPIMLALSTMVRGIVGNAPNHWGRFEDLDLVSIDFVCVNFF